MKRFQGFVSGLVLSAFALLLTVAPKAHAAIADLGVAADDDATAAATDIGTVAGTAIGIGIALVILGAGVRWVFKMIRAK